MAKILRLLVVFAVTVAALLGTTSVAAAATAPRPTPKQQQALCIAKKSVELLKAIDRQTWRDPRARAAAIKTVPAQAKAACPLSGTPREPYTQTVRVDAPGDDTYLSGEIRCLGSDRAVSLFGTVQSPGAQLEVSVVFRDGVAFYTIDRHTGNPPDAFVNISVNCEPA